MLLAMDPSQQQSPLAQYYRGANEAHHGPHGGEKTSHHQYIFSGDSGADQPHPGSPAPATVPYVVPSVDPGREKWQPGFVRRFPIVGFGSLVLSVCCEYPGRLCPCPVPALCWSSCGLCSTNRLSCLPR